MIDAVGRGHLTAAAAHGARSPEQQDAALRKACADLESVFINEMMKLMRQTIPEGGPLSGGTGEDIFTGLLDQRIAGAAAERLDRGLGAALYRRFRAGVGGAHVRGEAGGVPTGVDHGVHLPAAGGEDPVKGSGLGHESPAGGAQ